MRAAALWLALACGLGLPAGAVARAQTPDSTAATPEAPVPDSLAAARARADSLARRDSIARADTIAPGFRRSEMPPSFDLGRPYRWSKAQLEASGALTLGELLSRIPGATPVRTGWLTDVQVGIYAGAPGRVRVYVDGVEWDAIDPAGGGVHDVGLLQLWPYEEAVVERAGDELRVHLRTARDNKRSPLTRLDVLTGDREGNVFRGTFAQRFANGAGLQAVFSNASTRDLRSNAAGDGSLLSYALRAGWAGQRWAFDGWAHRAGADRRPATRTGFGTQPGDRPQVTLGYLRAAYRDPDSTGVFGQLLVGTLGMRETPAGSNVNRVNPGTPDTLAPTLREASRVQYVATAGWSGGGLRGSLTGRLRAGGGESVLSPLAQLSYDRGWAGVAMRAERGLPDSTDRWDASVRLAPFGRLALVATLADVALQSDSGRARARHWRAEAGVRVRGSLWLGGGVLGRDSLPGLAPLALDTAYVTAPLPAATGTFATIRGDLFRDLKIDAWAVRWADAAQRLYLPAVQARTQLYIESDWASRFPRRQFSFLGALIHDYRDPVRFAGATGVQTTQILRNLSTLVEIRLMNAVISWRFENILQLDFDQAPGYVLPRGVNLYGIRWEFRG